MSILSRSELTERCRSLADLCHNISIAKPCVQKVSKLTRLISNLIRTVSIARQTVKSAPCRTTSFFPTSPLVHR